MAEKPEFDPNQPYEPVGGGEVPPPPDMKPPFDPNQPFQPARPSIDRSLMMEATKPPFDSSQPFEAAPQIPSTDIPSAPEEAAMKAQRQPDADKEVPKPQEEVEAPGFWGTVTSAFSKGIAEQAASDVAGTKILLPKGMGGSTFEEQRQDNLMHPQTKDKVDELLDKPISEGWNDPMWWGAQLAKNVGGVSPGLGLALAASATPLGPLGGIAAFGLEAGLSRLVPAYNAARAKGLGPTEAIQRSLIDTGITMSFAAAMGLVGKFPLTGHAKEIINGEVATVLTRPMLEAFTQIGLVQPSLMASQDIVTDLSHGESPNAEQVLTDMAIGSLAGFGIHETFKTAERYKQLMDARAEMSAGRAAKGFVPATMETIAAAAEAQRPKGPTDYAERAREPGRPGAEPAAPVGPPPGPGEQDPPLDGAQYDRDITPKPGTPPFFSAVKDAVINKMPDNMNADSVLNLIAKQPYVTRAEMSWLGLNEYLKGHTGQVNKKDLLAHIESKEVQMEEVRYEDVPVDEREAVRKLYDKYAFEYGTPDTWPTNVRAHYESVRDSLKTLEPQWRTWNPPDAQNIREFVFKVPAPSLHPAEVERKAAEMWNERNATKWGPWESLSESGKETWRLAAKKELYQEDPRVFVGSHYFDPNAFAHARYADYIDRNGRKILMLVESQSDIHQEAQKMGKGYMAKDLPPPYVIDAKVEEARKTYDGLLYAKQRELERQGKDRDYALLDPKVKEAQRAWNAAVKESGEYWKSMRGKLPNLPFKTEWQELVVKRTLMLAADEGYDGVSWLNGDQVGLRLHDAQELKGARQNYGSTLNNLFSKWAKYVGSYTEPNRMTAFDRDWSKHVDSLNPVGRDRIKGLKLDYAAMKNNMWMPVGPEHSSIISRGVPMWDKDVQPQHPAKGTRTLSEAYMQQDNPFWRKLLPAAKKIDTIMGKIANEFRVGRGITFVTRDLDQDWRGRLVPGWDPATRNYVIEVNLRRILTEHDLYAAMSHEFGHVLYKELYEKASDVEKAAIDKAFDDFRKKTKSEDLTVGDVRRLRDNAISEMTGARAMGKDIRISDLDPGTKAYFLGKYEWWSEQVAKWMQTDAKPMSVVEKFFKRVANKIRKMLGIFTQSEHGPNAKPDQAVADFLNNRYGIEANWMEPPKEQFDMDMKKKAQAAFDKEGAPETKAVPQQASTQGGRAIISSLPPEFRGNGEGMAAAGDTMNWFYNIMTSLPQIAELNKHLRDLAEYADMHRLSDLFKNEIMSKAQDRDRQWSAIRDPKGLERVTNMMSEYAQGLFEKDAEDGVFRRPNANEFKKMVQKWGLSDQEVKLFQGVVQDFDAFLERYRQLLIQDAWKIKDDNYRKNTMENINARIDELLERPFMPLTRFGKYSISVIGADKKLRHYEQTNSLRRQKQIIDALEKHPDRLPGDQVLGGMVPKDVRPFLGMPPGLIDLISEKLSLSKTQQASLDQLKFDYAPAQTFKHQFRNLDLTPGWSTDYRRAYSYFFFHGANHITRITFADKMRDAIARLGSQENRLARAGQPGGANKLDKIVKYVQAHFDAFIDPKSDWAKVRGAMFHWYLGFNPASALVNLTQTPLMTHPYLASWFGDLASARAIAKASTDLNNFYRKTTLAARADAAKGTPGYEAARDRAFGLGIKYGFLSETQAHQLAAVAEDRNLMRIFGTKAEKFWTKFQDASSWMFETSEQWNRRVAFASAWDLAYNRPNHGLIREAINTYPLIYRELTDPRAGKNLSSHEAGSFLAAMRAVDKSQFTYAPYARPPIMRGKIGGTALVFKLFAQNSMFNIISNPSMAWRWALIMGALGGMQGLMGFENVNSLLKTLAYRAFGADFDLEDVTRHFAHDVLNDVIPSDVLMHGLASQGFGIPHVMNSMGVRSFPTVDMSKAVGLGDVLGFDPFKPMGPVRDPKSETLKEMTRGVGAAFSLPINLYEFAAGADNFNSLKKYEAIMPRWMGNLSKSYRYWTQGKEINSAGNAVVRFDPADTQQMMEILAQAAGLQPRRKTEEWERIQATAQAATYWDLRRQGLMRQFADAIKNNDEEGRDRVVESVRNYNQTLPEEARTKAITSKELKASVQQRLRAKALQEQGLPTAKANIPIAREIEKYYPRGWPKDLDSAKPVQ